jgi:hypothetical protein
MINDKSKLALITQVDDSGHRIPRDPAGTMEDSHSIQQENTGNRWKTEAVFRQESDGKHGKKSENFLVGILLSQNHQNYPEPAVSGPDCLTWDVYSNSVRSRIFMDEFNKSK